MSKEWILNAATNRFQLNFKRNVGAVAEEIRKCDPATLEEWSLYYFKHVRTPEHIEDLGRRLYIKVTEVIQAEVNAISEDDCIAYIRALVLQRTFEGYLTEKTTIYERLQKILGVVIEPAPDEWDRKYNVDFFVRVGTNVIGLQIKPMTFFSAADFYKWREVQRASHQKWQAKYGGAVFTVASVKQGTEKVIANPEIIAEIQAEIERLQVLAGT